MIKKLLLLLVLFNGFFLNAQPATPPLNCSVWELGPVGDDNDAFFGSLTIVRTMCGDPINDRLFAWKLDDPHFGAMVTIPPLYDNFSAGTGISFVNGLITNTAPATSRTFNNNVSRTLNSNYTISSTKDASVAYSVSLSVTNPLLAGSSTASAFLEYSTDGGSTFITVSQVANSSSVALTVTVQISQPNTFVLSGSIPANALVRLRTTTSGTANVTYVRGSEMYY